MFTGGTIWILTHHIGLKSETAGPGAALPPGALRLHCLAAEAAGLWVPAPAGAGLRLPRGAADRFVRFL